MLEFLCSVYMIVEIFVLIFCIGLFSCVYVDNGATGIIWNALIPQVILIKSCDGKINRTGKIVLLVLTAIFLVPVNVVLFVIEIHKNISVWLATFFIPIIPVFCVFSFTIRSFCVKREINKLSVEFVKHCQNIKETKLSEFNVHAGKIVRA